LERPPSDDGGAWDQLSQLAETGAGRVASSARGALDEIRQHRANQARRGLAEAGVLVGPESAVVQGITRSDLLVVLIGETWTGDPQSLHWLRWLSDVRLARVVGPAVRRDVLDHVVQIPDLESLTLINGEVDRQTLQPLVKMKRILSLEFRYVPLTDELGDLIVSIPIRRGLSLMGTGISAEKVEAMKSALPGLPIDHRQGGFLGVMCLDQFGSCRISRVVPESAAAEAGLQSDDVIVRIDQQQVERFQDLRDEINKHMPGDEVEIEYRRRGERITTRLKLRQYQGP
jgi:hypothetical protein